MRRIHCICSCQLLLEILSTRTLQQSLVVRELLVGQKILTRGNKCLLSKYCQNNLNLPGRDPVASFLRSMTRSISIFEVSDAREDSFLLDAVNFVVLRILSDAERLKLWQLPRR